MVDPSTSVAATAMLARLVGGPRAGGHDVRPGGGPAVSAGSGASPPSWRLPPGEPPLDGRMNKGGGMDDIDAWDAEAASDGLPEVADDDSYADGVHESARDRDVPGALPPDREDGPLGLEDYGITSAQRSRGEPLSGRLARETPEVRVSNLYEEPDPRLTEDVDPDAVDQIDQDSRMLAETEPIDPRLGSQVSMYDRPVQGIPFNRHIHGLVRPGSGYRSVEADEIAYDLGPAMGGLGSEELAMHEMPSEQVDLEGQESTSEPYFARPPGPVIRTGAEQPWDPEDLAVAEGRDPTPHNVERARRELEELGAAAIEKTVP